VAYAALTVAGIESPWVPRLQGAGLSSTVTAGLAPNARHGAEIFVDKSCWACHQIQGSGGRKGPDLSHVAARLSKDQIIARIASGGGGMPSFAGSLSPAELDDLAAFLATRN
jgi:ubiquinol-cytochrome c reductase cytochrome b subunit